MRKITDFFLVYLCIITDIIIMPFRYVWFIVTTPWRLSRRKRNWDKFQELNYEKIKNWMNTHGEHEKLPIYRDDNEQFHWVSRSQRKRLERELKRSIIKKV